MQGGVEALMGHGVEDVGGRVVWEHGEVIGMDADRVRVKYHSDKLKLWHRRFRMDYYGNLAKPVETTEVGGGLVWRSWRTAAGGCWIARHRRTVPHVAQLPLCNAVLCSHSIYR